MIAGFLSVVVEEGALTVEEEVVVVVVVVVTEVEVDEDEDEMGFAAAAAAVAEVVLGRRRGGSWMTGLESKTLASYNNS